GEPEAEVVRVAQRYGRRFGPMWTELQTSGALSDGDPLMAWRLMQLKQAVEHEMAVRLEDVVARRTSLLLFTQDNGQRHLEALGQAMGQMLGWDATRTAAEVERCRQRVQEMFAWKNA